MARALSHLKWEPLVCYNGGLGPIDDFGERQLPPRAEQHRDAASLGKRGVTGEPSPVLHTSPSPSSKLAASSVGGKGQRGEKVFFGALGHSAEGVVSVGVSTPASWSKGASSSLSLPIGLGPRWPVSSGRGRGGQGQGMPRLGLYLQGLEEVQGFRTVARDDAEGGIG